MLDFDSNHFAFAFYVLLSSSLQNATFFVAAVAVVIDGRLVSAND